MEDTLDTIAGKIRACLKSSDDKRISAGVLLNSARERVGSGEAGEEMTWELWCRLYVKRSPGEIRKLLALVKADDPAAKIAKERESNATQHREARANCETKRADIRAGQDGFVTDIEGWRQTIATVWNEGSAADQAWFRKYISHSFAEAAD
jgi:hypothetical protein